MGPASCWLAHGVGVGGELHPERNGGDSARTADAGTVRLEVEILVAAVPDAGAAARAELVTALTGRVADRVLADAQLVVSELVTNSVRPPA